MFRNTELKFPSVMTLEYQGPYRPINIFAQILVTLLEAV